MVIVSNSQLRSSLLGKHLSLRRKRAIQVIIKPLLSGHGHQIRSIVESPEEVPELPRRPAREEWLAKAMAHHAAEVALATLSIRVALARLRSASLLEMRPFTCGFTKTRTIEGDAWRRPACARSSRRRMTFVPRRSAPSVALRAQGAPPALLAAPQAQQRPIVLVRVRRRERGHRCRRAARACLRGMDNGVEIEQLALSM